VRSRNYFAIGGFRSIEMAKPSPQRVTLEISAYAFARVQAILQGVEDKQTFREIYKRVRDKFDRYALSPSQIKKRQLVFFPRLEDIRFENGEFNVAPAEHDYLELFKDRTEPRGADLGTRHESFGKVVDQVFGHLYENVEEPPEDLIHVTCSGYLAPSPAEKMVSKKNFLETTVTHSYHMGCYGAFPAIRMAHGFLASSLFGATRAKRKVDIVHTELLSLHRNFMDLSAENIITMTLFSDGFIKYSVYDEDFLRERSMRGLRILAFDEHLLPDSLNDMSWTPGSHQFHMTLTIMTPVIIKKYIRDFIERLFGLAGMKLEEDKDRVLFAIHPGGPKIVEHIQVEMGLKPDQTAFSSRIFLENGNMSSATVPHILKEMLDAPEVPEGSRIVAVAFGPGLTVTGLVVEKI
jgi:alkylresorcinol/alkylpyrone synthase